MKYSNWGIVVSIFLFIIPFLESDKLFYSATNTKFLTIVFVVDALLIGAGFFLFKDKVKLSFSKYQWFFYSALLVLAIYYLSSFLGIHPERSLWSDIIRSTGVLFLTHLFSFGVFLSVFLKKNDWSLIRRVVLFSAGLFGLLTIIGTGGFNFRGEFLWFDFASEGLTMGNSTFAGTYMLLAFIIGAMEVFGSGKRSWVQMGSLVAIAISPVMLNIDILFQKPLVLEPTNILGSARASSATLILLLIFMTGRWLVKYFGSGKKEKILQISWATIVLVGIISANILLFTPDSFVQNAYIEASTSARPIAWGSVMEAFKERPLFGWGPENFNNSFERNFDNRLFLKENIGEVWFDRAHNLFIDTLVSVGLVGLIGLVLLAATFCQTVFRSYKKGLVNQNQAVLLFALIPAHILQLQTGFDTIGSYLLLSVILGYVLWLERGERGDCELSIKKMVGVITIVLALASLKFVFYDEFDRQRALMGLFPARSSQEQQELAREATSRISNREGLRLASSSFIKGSLIQIFVSNTNGRQVNVPNVLKIAEIFEQRYREYLEQQPNDYRIRVNYAYLLLIQTTLGNDKLSEAKEIIENSYDLSPNNLITPALHATAFLYNAQFDEALERVDYMKKLNSEADFTKDIDSYINSQISEFPQIEVLRLENL